MLSKLLIQDKFDEFDCANLSYSSIQKKKSKSEKKESGEQIESDNYFGQIKKTKSSESFSDEMNIIELVDDKNYAVYENDVKYKIFEDISSISKSSCGEIELVLDIPYEHNIVSINKIKLSNELGKFVKNIYMMTGKKVIMTKEQILNDTNKLLKIKENINSDCSDGYGICLHIILDKDSLNHIINKNIFVNYSYAVLKNKLKFV
jgi:hypothetical protein